MSTKYLTVKEAANRAGKDEFLQNVRGEVIPRLIKKGLLQGKKDKNTQMVADDDALKRLMHLGVERFVQDQQGYSFMVVRAPIEAVRENLKARQATAKYQAGVKPEKMREDVEVQPDEKVRHAFLVQMRGTAEWCVLIQTVHWFQNCDAIMVTALASVLSKELKTVAAAAWDDDFSGSSLVICENGKLKESISDESEEDGWVSFYEFFYEQGIFVPASFIGTEGRQTKLHVTDPNQVQQADYVALKVPRPVKSRGPHVFEKLGMMAEAMAEGLEDEEEFMEHMHKGIWEQAQKLLAEGMI